VTDKKQITKKPAPDMILENIQIGRVSSAIDKDGDLEWTVPLKFKSSNQAATVAADLANMQLAPTVLMAKLYKKQLDLNKKKLSQMSDNPKKKG
jgi:hypothetical protein